MTLLFFLSKNSANKMVEIESRDFQANVMYFGANALSESAKEELKNLSIEEQFKVIYNNGTRVMLLLMNMFDP